jgi:RNA polymerase sigma-70 factor (ECF subfamily)
VPASSSADPYRRRGTFAGWVSLSDEGGLQLDSSDTVHYNAGTVALKHAKELDREGFGLEIMTHLDHLYRVAFYLVKNVSEAQDCVQETCVRALSAQGQFIPGSNLKAWLTKILYNFFYDFYARNKRVVAAEDLAESAGHKQDFFDTFPASSPGPETQLLAQELGMRISDGLKRIPDEFRAPIVLVDMGDFTYAETAEILSCPVGTVRSRLSRGRRLLQKILGGYGLKPAAGS